MGRNGKGCIIICAAGNHRWTGIIYPANLSYVLAVTGRGENDVEIPFSIGPEIDLFAPVQQFTLDEMGVEGYNNVGGHECAPLNCDRDYMCAFGGTSSSTPVVAGVASLLLRKFPELTRQEVFYILRNSADKTLDNGEIATGDGDIQKGNGRVDAFRALLSMSRGDCANDGDVDITDLSVLVDMLFISEQPLMPSPLLGDVNCDTYTDIADLTVLIDYLFVSQFPLAVPCFELGPYDN